ncbi:hypothetical protein D781_3994 [Serratia sp. FGI94]|uniref:helix-turn-helix domain-containing protein n=1 Tax=Serratia sp. FGI94 TaxID=671990 RepID=UPI0002A709AC|nr:helix-turn-helix transcriptional regulator [Serratia sp. FGI94]AGB84184.1 hypothetical protein D781_3994 [Serratia sp. FGI94]
MSSQAFVELALKTLSCSQKILAEKLGVSPAQISKWKKGEYMSDDMERKMRKITGVGEVEPDFVLLAGSLENARKWEKTISYLAEIAEGNAETGYVTEPLTDPYGTLCSKTFNALNEMGIVLPAKFPQELDVDYDDPDGFDWELLEGNQHFYIIYQMYNSLNDVYGFYAAYVSELMDDLHEELYDTDTGNIEPCLLLLASSKIEVGSAFAPKFKEFKYRITSDYERWLSIVKNAAFREGYPLKTELLDLAFASHDTLGHEAEAENLGFNKTRLHPDVYMNELLVGMRMIHQVLPAIMKKLGMEDEFKLDTSELRI